MRPRLLFCTLLFVSGFASAQQMPTEFMLAPARSAKTVRLPGTRLPHAHLKGSFQSSGASGGRVYFAVSTDKGELFSVPDAASGDFDVPIGKDGIIFTVRNNYPSDRRVQVGSQVVAGK